MEQSAFKTLLSIPGPPTADNVQKPQKLGEKELVKSYFEQLSKEDALRLYELYKEDFVMFGYKFTFQNMRLPINE